MNVGTINETQTSAMLILSHDLPASVVSLSITNPLLWPCGIVKCPSNAHSSISVWPGDFHLLFYEHCIGTNYSLAYGCHPPYGREVFDFRRCSNVRNNQFKDIMRKELMLQWILRENQRVFDCGCI